MDEARRLLCVFAHPDDESYGPGGSIAKSALEGVEVYLLMFTCGEAGSIGVSKDIPADELCRRRTSELAGACAALGIRAHRILGVPDGCVREADDSWAVAQIVDDIVRYRPQVLLTFHHLGVSGHPDHVAVADHLAKAFDSTADDKHGPKKLFGWGIPRGKAELYRRKTLVPLEEADVDAKIEIPDEAMENKLEAIRRHKTQYDFFLEMNGQFDYRALSRPEYFHLRKTKVPRPESTEGDFFGGIFPK